VRTVAPTQTTRGFEVRPLVATIVGIPAAVIVLAALDGSETPIVGSGTGAVVGLWVLGSIMCGQGLASMKDRFGLERALLIGGPFGLAALALVISAIAGWSLLLQPIADAMRGSGDPVSLDRAAIVGVGLIMVVKWTVAWLSYLPGSSAATPSR
jgi:hypothetical protein